MHPVFTRGLAVLALSLSPSALAHNSYVADVPNGTVNSCTTCHASGGEYSIATLNVFGQRFRTEMQAGKAPPAVWPGIATLDSDGDGQTNGQELGDPCGSFGSGSPAARTNDVSMPGDPESTTETPNAPDLDADEVSDWCDNCQTVANPDQADLDADGIGSVCDVGGEDTGGCGSAQISASAPGAASVAALAVLGLVALRRRRR